MAPAAPQSVAMHSHEHAHNHVYESGGHDMAFAVGTLLNAAFVIVEGTYGFISHSMALLADAGHNLSDVAALLIAWAASALARQRPSTRFTYGYRGSSILAALLNAVILFIAVGAIGLESVQRLIEPGPVASLTVIVVASIGIVVNGITTLLFLRGRHGDLNIRSAYLHMAADTLVSVGVVAAGAVIMATGWVWVDPAVGLVIVAVIVVGTWDLLRHSMRLALDAVPASIDPEAVRRHLVGLAGVAELHDLHIWPMSTTETALTCHLVMPAGHPGDAMLARLAVELRERFAIQHATIQVETGDPAHPCELVPDHVV
jgi:cobalt-zinc-cadmium efflux system protein